MTDVSESDLSDQYSFSSEDSAQESEMSDSEEGGSVSEATEGSRSVAEQVAKAKEKTPGVVYLSRVPPYMKPHKLKHLLMPYGRVGRVYLQPEGKLYS